MQLPSICAAVTLGAGASKDVNANVGAALTQEVTCVFSPDGGTAGLE